MYLVDFGLGHCWTTTKYWLLFGLRWIHGKISSRFCVFLDRSGFDSFSNFIYCLFNHKLTVFPFTLFHITICVEEASFSISFVFLPLTDVIGAIVPDKSTLSIPLVWVIHTFVYVSWLENVSSNTCYHRGLTFIKQTPQVIQELTFSKVLAWGIEGQLLDEMA